MGLGIWSMHFIGMLAFELPVPMQYEALETLISVLTAVLLTEVGLYVVAFQPFRKWNLSLAGLFMGLGIAGMHYIGMSAMRGDFAINYIPWGIGLSLVMAVATSSAAMWFAVRKRTLGQTAIVGIVLGIATSSMHYTSMLATRFYPPEAARPLALEPRERPLQPLRLRAPSAVEIRPIRPPRRNRRRVVRIEQAVLDQRLGADQQRSAREG